MCASRNFIFKYMQMANTYTIYTMHKIYKHVWIKSHYRKSGVTNFIAIAEKLVLTWMHY